MERSEYDAAYHDFYGGVGPYRGEGTAWPDFFGRVADQIIRRLRPRNTLEIGCAMGFLVEALRDRGVESHGVDVSEWAVSQVRSDIKPHCAVKNVVHMKADGARYDLIICMEVLEHLAPRECEKAVGLMCELGDEVLFSSSPDADHPDPTHKNVQQPPYWVDLCSERGFEHRAETDVTFVAQHAMLFRRRDAL